MSYANPIRKPKGEACKTCSHCFGEDGEWYCDYNPVLDIGKDQACKLSRKERLEYDNGDYFLIEAM